jgi:hypothetical protein
VLAAAIWRSRPFVLCNSAPLEARSNILVRGIPVMKNSVQPVRLLDFPIQPAPLPNRVQFFASGANRVEEIEGFAGLGIPVGVSIQHVSEAGIDMLIGLQHPVMVDSGAFSEVRTCPEGLKVVAPITESEWQRRLLQYRRLAEALGEKVLLVVPDRVGSQSVTLERIRRYRDDLLGVADCGARLLLPLQIGKLSHQEFYRSASEIAGVSMIPAMPMRKATTTTSDLLSFVEQVDPPHIHMLGAGIGNRRAAEILRYLLARFPSLHISMDSNRIRAVTGKKRPLTVCEERLRSEEVSGLYGSVESSVLAKNGCGLDYTDLIASPSMWASERDLAEIADHAGLNLDDLVSFLADPDEFLQSPASGYEDLAWIEHPIVAKALDATWCRFVARTIRQTVRTVAITEVFANSRISGQCRSKAA